MHTSRCVNMMIARVPAETRRIDPAFQPENKGLRFTFDYFDFLSPDQVFRAACKFNQIISGWEFELFTVRAVDLRMKIEVRREAFGLRRINMTLRIADDKVAGCGASSLIEHTKGQVR